MTDTDPLAHICSGWCNHPDVPTVIVTLAYLDKLRAAGVTLDPRPAPDTALREAVQEAMGYLDKVRPSGYHVESAYAALRAALENDHG